MIQRIRDLLVSGYYKLKYPKSLQLSRLPNVPWDTEITILQQGSITIGKGMSAFRGIKLSTPCGTLSIGNDVFFNRNCIVVSREKIVIGNNCIFGPNVVIYDHDHRFDEHGAKKEEYKTAPIIIEDNCWIGANAVILRGAHIGEGSVIGAGTIVKGDIPRYSLVTSDRTVRVQPLEKKGLIL